MSTNEEPAGRIALAIGPAVALAAAGLLEKVRDDFGVANVALVLSCIVVVAALAGRAAGLATAVTAALAYNFFHTRPYYSLRINSGRDIATVGLLVIIGVIVSEMGAWRRRALAASTRRLHGSRALEAVAAQLAAGSRPEEIWDAVREGVDGQHSSWPIVASKPDSRRRCSRYRARGRCSASRCGWAVSASSFRPSGAAIAVAYAGRTLGHIVLVPSGHTGSQRDIRQVAVALADEYAVALAGAEHAR